MTGVPPDALPPDAPAPANGHDTAGPGEQTVDSDEANGGEDAPAGDAEVTGADVRNGAEQLTPPGESAQESTAADLEGPRRRARRERAERRAAQQRATAIEEARREAKRRARGQTAEPVAAAPDGVKGLKALVWTALLTIATVALGLVLYFTPLMSVRSLNILGTDTVPQEEVLAATQVSLGTPLLQIDTDAVAERVASIRRVASVRVQREYPSTLRITVQERIPLVVKDYPDGPHLFDKDGVDFVTAPPPPGLPYIDTESPGPNDPATDAALEVLTALPPEVSGQVSRVEAPSVAAITLILFDGRKVVWGTTDRTEEKALKLAALLTQPGQTYDVSSPDLPTVK